VECAQGRDAAAGANHHRRIAGKAHATQCSRLSGGGDRHAAAITEAISAVVVSADLVLIPTRPSPHDLRAVGSTVSLVQGARKPFVFAVTQAKPNTRLTVQAMAALSQHGQVAAAIIHDRVDYAGSMIDARTVQEIDPRGRSAAEITELWEFLKAQITDSTKARKEVAA
jgi:chromosome partitioning protein